MKDFLKVSYILSMAALIVMLVIVLTKEIPKYGTIIPEIGISDASKLNRLKISEEKKEQDCLIEVLWHEARGEGLEGMKAVANVVLNRVNSKHYGGTICDVVDQPKQFSYRNHLKPSQRLDVVPNQSEVRTFAELKESVTNWSKKGLEPVVEPETLWYHTTTVKPKWSRFKTKVKQIGKHVFFKKDKK